MKFLIIRTEPCQELAAEPVTLAALIKAFRTVPVPPTRPDPLAPIAGIDLVKDPALLPGTLHIRPRKVH
ncbi:hypothetical protein ABZY90_19710 [Streptomyces sp. NPDC006422]|uniref:hypothetical protein n=1 Tax=unclassified Streptomyces TaxID=2593676 RepID=UPI0033AB78AE